MKYLRASTNTPSAYYSIHSQYCYVCHWGACMCRVLMSVSVSLLASHGAITNQTIITNQHWSLENSSNKQTFHLWWLWQWWLCGVTSVVQLPYKYNQITMHQLSIVHEEKQTNVQWTWPYLNWFIQICVCVQEREGEKRLCINTNNPPSSNYPYSSFTQPLRPVFSDNVCIITNRQSCAFVFQGKKGFSGFIKDVCLWAMIMNVYWFIHHSPLRSVGLFI